MKSLTILVVEDHFLIRIALRGLLATMPEYRIISEATTGQQAIDLYNEKQPDLVIMDLRLNGLSGFEAIRTIHKNYPRAKILAISTLQGSEDIYRAIDAGASGYVTKDLDGQQLGEALRTVAEGGRYVPKALQLRLEERLPGNCITPREKLIIELLARGLNTAEIAIEAHIAEKTVRIHISNIFEKLGARDRTQLLLIALERGIIHLGSGSSQLG
ncbi:MAG: response regulator transcription factor [Acidobacteria bacterium]|nr:response regulator transcription factor [Acidobacteriota bacterium]